MVYNMKGFVTNWGPLIVPIDRGDSLYCVEVNQFLKHCCMQVRRRCCHISHFNMNFPPSSYMSTVALQDFNNIWKKNFRKIPVVFEPDIAKPLYLLNDVCTKISRSFYLINYVAFFKTKTSNSMFFWLTNLN